MPAPTRLLVIGADRSLRDSVSRALPDEWCRFLPVGESPDHDDTIDAGLICLPSVRESARKDMAAYIKRYRQWPWIALASNELMQQQDVRELVAASCVDYHSLPLDPSRLTHSLGHARGMWRLIPSSLPVLVPGLLGESAAMCRVRQMIEACANSHAPVLITGESGTGKEVVARALHARTSRCNAPMVAVNCGAFPEGLIQSELFGHRRGAFTGALTDREGKVEAARGGSLFLDEIGDLPRLLQVHLLRFLQEGVIEKLGQPTPIAVDVRIIAATHVDLEQAVHDGRFREDLLYRLNVLQIRIPPLRERPGDIPALADHYLARHADESRRLITGFTQSAYEALCAYSWPGNVRELVNVVRRAAVLSQGGCIDADILSLSRKVDASRARPLAEARAAADREAIETSLAITGHNIAAASRLLEISRLSLYRLMEKYHVRFPGASS